MLLVCLVVGSNSYAAPDRRAERARIAPEYNDLQQKIVERQAIPVIVRFKVDKPDGRSQAIRREAGRQRLKNAMAPKNIRPFAEYRRSGLSAYFVNAAQLDALIDSGLVDAVRESKPRKAHLQQSNDLVDSQTARNYGFNGNGAVTVILDTGIDAAHSTFDNRVVWEACFSTNWAQYSATNLCPAGGNNNATQYFQSGPGAAAPTKCTDVPCWHGTHVAAIAAGSNTTYTGMAPEAGIIAIQVFSRFSSPIYCGIGNAPCILSFDHDQLSALEYVADLTASYNIASVNMSLGGGNYSAACDGSSNFTDAIDALESLGIIVAASSGNDYYTSAMGHPACLSKVVSVGSVLDTSDTVSSFSNSASFLDVLAPGQPITAGYPGGGYATASGTSMAAPHVAGALAVMKSFDSTLTYAEMKSLLIDNGDPVLDTRNGLTFPRLNLGAISLALFETVAGDANDDGKLDAADLLLLQRHLTGAITLDPSAVSRCDVHPTGNPNGLLGASDLVRLEQMLLAP